MGAMDRMLRVAWVLPLGLLGALTPRISKGELAGAPLVDLGHIRVGTRLATAPAAELGDATLTLDPALQRAALALLDSANPIEGAVVAIDVKTGRALAWAERSEKHRAVLGSARAPSASLFKLVTSAALLEVSGVPPETRVCYSGGQRRIERRHLDPPHGVPQHCSSFFDALGHSRNAVFAQLVTHHLARSELTEMASRLGFGKRVPFDVPVLVGNVELPYDDLGFARAAAGFGKSTLSPLGAAWLAYTVASGGASPRVRIVEHAGEWQAPPGRELVGRAFGSATANALLGMMEVTVSGGTSREAFHDANGQSYLGSIHVAGKTGTLQPDQAEPTASWFTGFAPSRRPAIVVTVMLQNGKVWRKKANELARDLLRVYFARRGFRGVTDPLAGG